MATHKEHEKRFFQRALITSIFPNIDNVNDVIIGPPQKDLVTGLSYVKVRPWLNSKHFFKEKNVTYSRFRLEDYKNKINDPHLEVPCVQVQNPHTLVNYMNEIYLHSFNTRKTTSQYDVLTGLQIELRKDTLKAFDFSSPIPGQMLLLEAEKNSYLFEGSLKIKFI